MIESPGHDLLPLLAKDKNIKLFNCNPTGNQYTFRFNSTAKPFDNAKIRHAVFVAFAQEDFLKATIGDPQWFKVCKAPFVCGTPLATDAGMADVLNGNAAKAKQLLTEAGYDGTPIVLMQSTDLQVLTNLAPVAKAQLERAGFKVDMVSMDWQTLVARRTKKDPPDKGGWHAFLTSWVAADILNPVMAGFFNAVVRQGDVRLAVRRRDREVPRPVRQGDRSGQAEGDRREPAEVLGRPSDPHQCRPVVRAVRAAQQRRRQHDRRRCRCSGT